MTLPGMKISPEDERYYTRRPWSPEEVAQLTNGQLRKAVFLFNSSVEAETRDSVKTFTMLVDELHKRNHIDRTKSVSGRPRRYADNMGSVRVRDGQYPAYRSLQIARKGDGGVLLFGPPGGGKTHLASAWCETMAGAGELVRFISWTDLVTDERRRMDKLPHGDMLGDAKTIGRVVIDDFGSRKTAKMSGDLAFEIVDARLRNKLQTVITCNGDPGQLMDERLQHRLRDLCEWVEVTKS